MIRNQNTTAPASTFRGDRWAALDRLPQPLRRALHEAIIQWDPRWVRWELNKLIKQGHPQARAVTALVEYLREEDDLEVSEFGRALPRNFGGQSPHQRAQVSIQRYDSRAA